MRTNWDAARVLVRVQEMEGIFGNQFCLCNDQTAISMIELQLTRMTIVWRVFQ